MAINTINNDLDQFYRYLQSEKRYSTHTVKAYQRDIKHLADCLALNMEKAFCWDEIRQADIRRCVARLHRQGLSGKSLQRWLSSVRSLFNYLCRFRRMQNNPAAGLPAPKSAKRLPATLNIDEINGLLDATANNDNKILYSRDIAMMELMYACGLRLSELSSLDLLSIDWQQKTVMVTGKGHKQRKIPFGRKAESAVRQWLEQRKTLLKNDEPALFLSQRGQRLSNSSIQKRFKKMAQEKGLNTNVYPHMLRHTFASHFLESSKDLRMVQTLLGHANLSTTQIYTHLDFQHLAGVYDAAHPRARKK